jgi:phage/plasmid-like protein (TIGR03299 family)
MAHNLYYNQQTGSHSFFSVQQKPWHGLGTIVEDYPTSTEAIRFAGLDYTVEKRPLFTHDHFLTHPANGTQDDTVNAFISVPNYYATIRTDTQEVLGVVGKDYQIVQNSEAFSFFDSIVQHNRDIKYETAGVLGRGERIFITAKLPGYIRIARDDLIEQYVFLTTSHDGYGSITAAFTPIRIVCQNTLNAAIRSRQHSIKIRHTSSAVERLKQAHQLMGMTNSLAGDMEALFNHWSRVRITDKALKDLIGIAMAPSKEVLGSLQEEKFQHLSTHYLNMVDDVLEYAVSAPSQQQVTTKGTLFGAYNAVTGYFQNVRAFGSEEMKLKSILWGTGLQRAQTTFKLCENFARTGIVQLN